MRRHVTNANLVHGVWIMRCAIKARASTTPSKTVLVVRYWLVVRINHRDRWAWRVPKRFNRLLSRWADSGDDG